MLFFDHNTVNRPVFFDGREVRLAIERLHGFMDKSDLERSQSDAPLESNVSTMHDSLEDNLEFQQSILKVLLDITHGACAFCEGHKSSIQAFRFRPDYEAQPFAKDILAHEYYQWFKWEWTNFYPICDDCHPGDLQNFFPVRGQRHRPTVDEMKLWKNSLIEHNQAEIPRKVIGRLKKDENPIFLEPGQIRNYGHTFSIDRNANLIGNSSRAKKTIEHFKLNAEATVHGRRKAIYSRVDQVKNGGGRTNFDFDKIEYGGAVYLFLRDIVDRMKKQSSVKGRTYIGDIHNTITKLSNEKIWSRFDEFAFGTPDNLENAIPDKGSNQIAKMSNRYEKQKSDTLSRARYSRLQPSLKNISIRNFKSLQKIIIPIGKSVKETVNKTQFSLKAESNTACLLMLGENATGKSSLLEAVTLAAVSRSTFEDLEKEVELKSRHHILNPKYLGSPNAQIPKSALVELKFEDNDGPAHIRTLTIDETGFHHNPENSTDDFLIFAYGAHRLFGKTATERKVKSCDNVITLFRNDLMTMDPEKWIIDLEQKDSKSLNEIAKALRHVIQLDGEFENIDVQEDKNGKKFCQINLKRSFNVIYRDEEEGKDVNKTQEYVVPTPLEYVSSGYRVIIALVCDVFKGIMDRLDVDADTARRVPVLILIDEIEAHLHPRWKLEIISGLRRALPAATFVMSSHDPLCIRGMQNGEVVVFNRYFNEESDSGESDTINTREMVETITEFPDFQSLTVEQLLTSDLFQLYSSDDRRIEKEFSEIAQVLEREKTNSMNANDIEILREFRNQINESLPIGMTEAERVVQEAVADYLALRRDSNQADRSNARRDAKKKILNRLMEVAGYVDIDEERA